MSWLPVPWGTKSGGGSREGLSLGSQSLIQENDRIFLEKLALSSDSLLERTEEVVWPAG